MSTSVFILSTIFQISKGKFCVLQTQTCRNLKSIKFSKVSHALNAFFRNVMSCKKSKNQNFKKPLRAGILSNLCRLISLHFHLICSVNFFQSCPQIAKTQFREKRLSHPKDARNANVKKDITFGKVNLKQVSSQDPRDEKFPKIS